MTLSSMAAISLERSLGDRLAGPRTAGAARRLEEARMRAEEAALDCRRALARSRRRTSIACAERTAGKELRISRREALRSRRELEALAERVANVVCATVDEAVPLARALAEARRTLAAIGFPVVTRRSGSAAPTAYG